MNTLEKIDLYLSETNGKKSGDEEEYRKFFNKMMKIYGISSPDELDKEKRKEFFDAVDAGWKADHETKANETVSEATDYYARELMEAGTTGVKIQVWGNKGKSKTLDVNNESKDAIISYLKKLKV